MVVNCVVMGVFLTAFGGYVLTSLLLLRFPSLLHKRKKQLFKAVHISHRGGAGENLENTLTAFRHAVSVGTEMLEIDCQITSDGEVVVTHDNHLSRSTGQEVDVSDTEYKELPKLKTSLRLDFQQSHECITEECSDRRIPLLREVLAEFHDTPLNIDIKRNDDLLVTKVNKLITEFGREDSVVWGNHSAELCSKLYKLNPRVPQFFSLRQIVVTTLLFYTGLLPFVSIKQTHYEMLMPSIALKKDKFKDSSGFSWKLRFLLKIVDFLVMNRFLISHLKRRGIEVYLWVLNEEDEFERAFKLGATGVMTDFPTKLTSFLQNHPEFRNKAVQ